MPKDGSNEVTMLTTIDNPWNPFRNWDEWYAYDERMGYCTCGLIARLAATSDAVGDDVNTQEIEDAKNEIIRLNPNGLWCKVRRNDKTPFVRKAVSD